VIGQTYLFEDVDGRDITGTVTAATVDPAKKEALIAVTDAAGKSCLLRSPMSDEALAEHARFGDAYFGKPSLKQKKTTNVFELFDWLMEANKGMRRSNILAFFSAAPNLLELEMLSDEELRITYCEALVAGIEAKKAKQEPGERGHRS
jgi:hypothetical protein